MPKPRKANKAAPGRPLDAKQKLIRKMVKTFDDLGADPMARIDARLWADYYRKRASKLGVPAKAA